MCYRYSQIHREMQDEALDNARKVAQMVCCCKGVDRRRQPTSSPCVLRVTLTNHVRSANAKLPPST